MTTPQQRSELIAELSKSELRGPEFRALAMTYLSDVSGYDWVGFYRLDGDELMLESFVGEPTDHVRIPVGTGVCGSAVSENRNKVIDDVSRETNYLSCSAKTKSEIVVLVRREGQIVGQIDADGHTVAAFDGEDEGMLQDVARLMAERWA